MGPGQGAWPRSPGVWSAKAPTRQSSHSKDHRHGWPAEEPKHRHTARPWEVTGVRPDLTEVTVPRFLHVSNQRITPHQLARYSCQSNVDQAGREGGSQRAHQAPCLRRISDPARGSHHSAGKDREGRVWRGRRQGGATLGGEKRISRWVRSGPTSRPGALAWRARGPSTLAQARPAAHEALGHRSVREGGRQGDWAQRKAESARATQLVFQMPCFPGQLNHGHISHLGAGTQACDRIPGSGNRRTRDPVSTCPEGSRGKACLDIMAGPPSKQPLTRPLGPGHPCPPRLQLDSLLQTRLGPWPSASDSTCLTLGHAPPQRPGPTCPSGSEPSTAAQQVEKQGSS